MTQSSQYTPTFRESSFSVKKPMRMFINIKSLSTLCIYLSIYPPIYLWVFGERWLKGLFLLFKKHLDLQCHMLLRCWTKGTVTLLWNFFKSKHGFFLDFLYILLISPDINYLFLHGIKRGAAKRRWTEGARSAPFCLLVRVNGQTSLVTKKNPFFASLPKKVYQHWICSVISWTVHQGIDA
jgi:hypothetical protein